MAVFVNPITGKMSNTQSAGTIPIQQYTPGQSVGSGNYQTYSRQTGSTVYSNTEQEALDLSGANFAGTGALQNLESGAKTQASVNQNTYKSMTSIGATPQQIFQSIGGYGNSGIVPGLTQAQNSLLPIPELVEPIKYSSEISATELEDEGDFEDFNKWSNEDVNKRNQLMAEVISQGSSELATADFINQVALSAHGRPASKDELEEVGKNKYGLIGATKNDVLGRFGLQKNETGSNGFPTNSSVVDSSGAIVGTDEAGVPDVSMSPVWQQEMEQLMTEIAELAKDSAEETALGDQIAQAKGSAELGVLNVGNQLGEAMPLIQGEQQYLVDKANIQLQTLASRLGVLQGARKNELLAKQGEFDMKNIIQQRIMEEKQMIYNEMQRQSTNAQNNLAMILSTYQASGGVDTSQMSPAQKTQLNNLAKQAGLDGALVFSAIDAIYNGAILDGINKQMSDVPTSYKEWQLAGSPGTYEGWVKDKGTTPELPIVKVNGVDYYVNEDGSLDIIKTPVDTEATQLQKNALDSAVQLLDMFNSGYGKSAVGFSTLLGGGIIPGTKGADFKTKFDNLSATLQLDAVKYLKGQGQVSDSERKILSDAVSGLSRKQSEKAFKSTLQDVIVGLGKEGTVQVKDDGTYVQKLLNGEIRRGKVGDNYIDKTTPRQMNMSGVTSLNYTPTSQSVAKLKEIPDGLKGGQCGRFVNQITGLGVGDSYESKMSKMDPNIKKPAPGMIFVMPYKDTGHIGFIVGIEGQYAIVKDSNYFNKTNPEMIQTHKLPISSMTGFRALA